MHLVIEGIIDKELSEFLKTQNGINDAKVETVDFVTTVVVDYDKDIISPYLVFKYIEMFKGNSIFLIEFDKGYKENCKTLNYHRDNACCEMCYRLVVNEMFEEKSVRSYKSTADLRNFKDSFDITIEYDSESDDRIVSLLDIGL